MSATEQPLAIEVTDLELIEWGLGSCLSAADRGMEWLRPLLSCGHYGAPVFDGSSQWDFPDDEHACPTCGETRQWHLRVQAALANA
ncbi:MAG TPA: hypothetical protein VMW08_00500 [Acidimicrobiales bacterium]|nr:hypothetical protein [Acidimicrobiales bacterium]